LDIWGRDAICRALGRNPNTSPSTGPKYFAGCAHVLRYCGRLLRPYDERKAAMCAESAARTVKYLEGLRSYPAYQELEVRAGLALYYLEESRDGGGEGPLRRAEECLEKMLSLQQPEGHFRSSRTCRGLEFCPEEAGDERVFGDYPFGYMFAFIEYLEYAAVRGRKHCRLKDEARTALCRFAGLIERFCRADVFRHPTEIRFDRPPHVIIPMKIAPHGYNPYIIAAGAVLAAAGRYAGFPNGPELGERQLQWVLGANPRFMSFMNQVGVRNAGQYAASTSATWQRYPMAFYRHLRDMRWGVTIGIYGPRDGQPANYPNAGDSAHGRYDNTAQETWLNCNGWLLLLLAYLRETR